MISKFAFARGCSLLATGVLLAGCSLAPKYVRPVVETPAAYKEAGDWKPAQPRDDTQRGKWWEVFGDAQLNALEEQVSISNQSIVVAEAQYRQAQALAAQARSGLFPSVTGSVSATRGEGGTRSTVSNQYNLVLSPSWQADLWGGIRNSVAASTAGAQASAALLEGARLSVQGELALNYFQLRILDATRQLLDDSVAAFQKSLDMTRNRYEAGVAGRVDVVQAQTQVETTRSQAIDVGVQRAQLEHAIAILLGKPPSQFSLSRAPLRTSMPAIPVGVPSELLERRPDIAAAERRVAAANAQIGVAKAAFFPALTLSASAGFQSSSLPDWLIMPSRLWSIGPAIAQSIFDAGLRRAVSEQALAAYDANVAAYRLTVLGGFREVEDNLSALRILEQEAGVQDVAVRSARQSVELTLNQYKAGTVSFLNVVLLQTVQLNNERVAVSILGRRLVATVALVESLGGGWSASAPAAR